MTGGALDCFTSLLEDVPGWIAELETILKTAEARQEEMLSDNQPAGFTPLSFLWKTKSKSSSMMSKRSRDRAGGLRTAQHPQAQRLATSDALRLSQRKRKTTSACSVEDCASVKLRIKTAAAVYYDGETQKHFEKMVRSVGSSRNSLRKGKMAAKVDNLSRSGSSCSDMSSDTEDDIDDSRPTSFRLDLKSTRPPRLPFRRDDTESFDKVDGCLEKAQLACERAAHQVLREGDCSADVNKAKDHLQQALKLSEAEVPLLRKKAEKAEMRRKRSEERRQAELEAQERRKPIAPVNINIVGTPFSNGGRLSVDELEVDDDSDDVDAGEFNVCAMRGNFSSFARGSRLTTAH